MAQSRAEADGGGPTALIAHLQRMSTEDGPGLRTSVFFKGCPLACSWCHNPECLSQRPQVVWNGVRCIGCGTCAAVCPTGSIEWTSAGVSIDRSRCQGCGTCAEACPSMAMELIGRRWSVDDLVCEVAKDRSYFSLSGGGVTLSGGEPAVPARFVEAFLARCRALGIRTAVDTSGSCRTEALLSLARLADLVLYDIKIVDPALHATFTGKSNRRILANLFALRDSLRAGDAVCSLWIRTPLIPGATASEENIGAIGALVASELGGLVGRWELCAFNNLCRDKYLRLGMKWAFSDCELLSTEELERWGEIARHSGVDPSVVLTTGTTRIGGEDGAGGQSRAGTVGGRASAGRALE